MQRFQIADASKISQQQETLLEILVEHPRRGQTGLGQQRRHLDEWPAVFMFRRRIHQDARRPVRQAQTEVTTKTGIGRSRDNKDILSGKALRDPVSQQLIACV